MKKKLLLMFAFVLMAGFVSMNTDAAAKKMTAYKVIKSGNTVYCTGDGSSMGIYKVNLKNGKVKRLVKNPLNGDYGDYWFSCMAKKGNYLYYYCNQSADIDLRRVNIKTGKSKVLCSKGSGALEMKGYVLSGSRIYYRCSKNYGPKKSYVMKNNGKAKKSTSVKAVMKKKYSNAKGYRTFSETKGNYISFYLKTPDRTYFLERVKLLWL
ncbi:MAG: hypothetical protein IJ137_01890 [Eubacterium sp.]|nr:hypothetical protein [Eubacterium sp.]